jgi:hypothetical protein
MLIYEEQNLRDFEFWSGGYDRAKELTSSDWDIVESELEAMYPDGMSSTQLNDLFWFDFDMIAQFLGYDSESDMDFKRDPNYIEDDYLEDYVVDWFKKFLDDLYVKCTSGDEKHQNDARWNLRSIAENLFGLENEYKENDDDNKWLWCDYYKRLMEYIKPENCSDIFETLFDDDNGYIELDGVIPKKNDFRKQIMLKNEIENGKAE